MSLQRNALLSAAGGMLTVATGLVSGILVARLLGPEAAGAIALAGAIAGTAVFFADPGVSTSIIRFVPELRAQGEDRCAVHLISGLFRVFLLNLAVVTAVLLALWFLFAAKDPERWGVTRLGPSLWALIGLYFIGLALGAVFTAYLKGMQQFGRLARVAAAASTLHLVVLLVGIAALGVSGALMGYVAGAMLPAVLALGLNRRREPLPADLRRRVVKFALMTWAVTVVSGLVWFRAELLFLQMSWGFESVGYYSAGLSLANVATLLPALLMGALLPHFSSQVGTGAFRQMRTSYAATTRVIALIVFPACFGAAAISPVLIPLIYGPLFAPAVAPAMIIIGAAAISIAAAPSSTAILTLERTHVILIANLIGVVLVVAAGLIVIPRFGMEGAALSRGLIQGLVAAIEVWYVATCLRLAVPFAAVLRTMVAALVSALAAYLCVRMIGGPASLLLAIPAGVLVYAASVRLLGVLHASDRALLDQVTQRLPVRLRDPFRVVVELMFRDDPVPGATAR